VSSPPPAPRPALVVAALSLTEIVSWGILYYAFGVLVPPMQAELGWSQGFLGGAFALALLVSALLAVPLGRHLDRRGPRGLMTAGSLAGAGLVALWSTIDTRLGLVALCVALGFPLASTLYEAAFAAVVGVTRAGRERDLGLLVLTVVAGLASTVFVPLTQLLVDAHGWRAALRWLAVALAVLTVPLHAGLLPTRAPLPPPPLPPARAPEPAAGEARRLGLTAAAFGLATLAGTSLGVFLVPILIEQGFSARFAAGAGALIGVGQVLGRLAFTFLRTRYALPFWSHALFLPGAVGLLVLATRPSGPVALAAVLLFALASGGQTLGRTAWTLELFELARFGRVNGVLGRWSLIGRACAPLLLGAAHDALGSHGPGLVALALLFVLGGWCARRAARAPRGP